MINAIPKFVDIEPESFGIYPTDMNKKISQKTEAVIPVHYAGLPCKINEIKEITKRKKIPLVEDAAESLGASVKKQKVGTFGDLAIFHAIACSRPPCPITSIFFFIF